MSVVSIVCTSTIVWLSGVLTTTAWSGLCCDSLCHHLRHCICCGSW